MAIMQQPSYEDDFQEIIFVESFQTSKKRFLVVLESYLVLIHAEDNKVLWRSHLKKLNESYV